MLAGLTRVVLSGASPDGEQWQSGFALTGLVMTGPTDANNAATEVANAASQKLGALENFMPPGMNLSKITVYYYATNSDTATYVGEAPVSGVTGVGGGTNPLQTCVVATLRTNFSGRRYRGRMYLPAVGIALGAGSYIPTASLGPLCSAIATFFNQVTSNTGGVVAVYSTVGAMAHPVTTVTMDNRPDVQRRRANKQGYTVLETAPVGS